MAKRYIKRYYIRPQNIFCSNKAEILNALVKEVGENNCSVYSLKALDDHDDVHLLQPKDIIYYYDDGILYDKNHVKVMDYDLNVKHEEERKKFGNIDTVSDATFDAEYEDRLTEDLYKLPDAEELAFNQKVVDEINNYILSKKPVIKIKVPMPGSYTGPRDVITYVEKAELLKLPKEVRIELIAYNKYTKNNKEYFSIQLDDCFKEPNRVSPKQKIKKDEHFRKYSKIISISDGFTDFLNKIAREKEELYLKHMKYKLSAAGKANDRISKLDAITKKIVKNWFAENITKIEFLVPSGDVSDIAEIQSEADLKLVEQIGEYFLEQQTNLFNWYNLNLVPSLDNKDPILVGHNIVLKWRIPSQETPEKTLSNYLNFWANSSVIYLKQPLENAPEEVKNVVKEAKRRSKSTKAVYTETKNIISSNILSIEIINELFEGDLNFLINQELTNPFNQEFDDVNVYGEKTNDNDHDPHYQESLIEATSSKKFICCICGEESEGYGNNPEPVRKTGQCCDACNRKFVIPARIEVINLDME